MSIDSLFESDKICDLTQIYFDNEIEVEDHINSENCEAIEGYHVRYTIGMSKKVYEADVVKKSKRLKLEFKEDKS